MLTSTILLNKKTFLSNFKLLVYRIIYQMHAGFTRSAANISSQENKTIKEVYV